MCVQGCALSLVDNVYWHRLFKASKPSFDVPSRYEVSNKLLDMTYDKTASEVNGKIKDATSLAIQCDGWSNVRNKAIIYFIVNTPEPVFYKSVSTGVNSQDGAYYADQINTVIEEVGQDKVIAVCTDNASVRKKAWSILEQKYGSEI